MSLNAKKAGAAGQNRVEQPTIDPGVYPGRLVQIIDLGVQAQRPYKGQDKPPVQEIMLTYELVDVFMLDDKGEEVLDKPRWISETLPFYGLFADKAKSTQRYNAFDPKGVYDGDLVQAITQPVNITLVNNISGEKIYTNVANVATMRPRDVASCPELKNPSKVFNLDEPDLEVFNSIPEWIRDKIKSNINYQGSALEELLKGKPVAKSKLPNKPVKEGGDNPETGAHDDAGDRNPY